MARDTVKLETTLPRVWFDRLQALARERGQSLEDLTQEAIATYLGISPLEREILELKQKMPALSSLSEQISDLNRRLSLLEARSTSQAPAVAAYEENDEEEDEPDEILNDFLQG